MHTDMVKLQTRRHPLGCYLSPRGHAGPMKVQYRFINNTGRWAWGPGGVKRAPCKVCRMCGTEQEFYQDARGVVWSVCPNERCQWHSDPLQEWWPSRANETHHDSGASYNRVVREACNG